MAYPILAAALQLFDDNGQPLDGGLIYVYEPSTTTAKASYPTAADADARANPNVNPVVLDGAGRGQIWAIDGEKYKVVIKTSAGITIDSIDNISANDAGLITFTQSNAGAVARTVQVKLEESTSVKDFGAVCDGVTDDTVAFQAALNAVAAAGTPRNKVVVPPGSEALLSAIEIPVGVIFDFSGCYLKTTSKPGIRVNTRSKVYGFNGRLTDTTGYTHPHIEAADLTSVTAEVELIGFEMVSGTGASTDSRAIDISTFYNCIVDVRATNYGICYFQQGSVQCYYNRLYLNTINCHQAMLTQGALFNANHIHAVRCQVNYRGILMDNATGNVIHVHWIEGCTNRGIYLRGSADTVIIGGNIEGVAGGGGVAGIELAVGTDNTVIVGTGFGGEFATSTKKLIASESCTNTTYLGPDTIFFAVDGAITTINTERAANFGGPVILSTYKIATLPPAATYTRGMIYVSDESGGATVAYSNGVNWLRVRDNVIVS